MAQCLRGEGRGWVSPRAGGCRSLMRCVGKAECCAVPDRLIFLMRFPRTTSPAVMEGREGGGGGEEGVKSKKVIIILKYLLRIP